MPTQTPSLKLIITSKKNLRAKYGRNFSKLEALLKQLVLADKKRNLATRIVYLDEAASVRSFGLQPIDPLSERACKEAVDLIYQTRQPAYMLLFGAQDVFPFQQLRNELFGMNGDVDQWTPSDLPYACEAPFGDSVGAFVNPTRVVGRLPDHPGMGDVEFVKMLIQNSIKQKERPAKDYQSYFALTAQVWTQSTRESIRNVFGNNTSLLDSPTAASGKYTKRQLAPLSHFYNCHGAPADPRYYGEGRSAQPTALAAGVDLPGRVSYGTVMAAECCYGIQVMNPQTDGISVAASYLQEGALAVMGSSNIAYGPSAGQGLADLICQYFLKSVLCGASTGRALLEARQKFLNVSAPTLDPHELKTLAQFYLLGDPSLSPVKTPESKDVMNTVENRRLNLYSKGINIGASVNPARLVEAQPGGRLPKQVQAVLRQAKFSNAESGQVFQTTSPREGESALLKAFTGGTVRFRTFQRQRPAKAGSIPFIEALVIKETDQEVLGWKVYYSR